MGMVMDEFFDELAANHNVTQLVCAVKEVNEHERMANMIKKFFGDHVDKDTLDNLTEEFMEDMAKKNKTGNKTYNHVKGKNEKKANKNKLMPVHTDEYDEPPPLAEDSDDEDDIIKRVRAGDDDEDSDDDDNDDYVDTSKLDMKKLEDLNPEDENVQKTLFGTVVRLIDAKSDEAKTEKMQKAVQKEMDNLQHEGAFNLSEVIEWDVARQMYPDAIVVGSRMIRCEKGAELMLPEELKIYKGRLVAQGNHMVHSSGVKIYDQDVHHGEPIQLDESKMLMGQTLTIPGAELLHGDVRGAYVKAPLRGRKVFVRIDKTVRPAEWAAYKDPVVLARRAVYGLGRSDADWGDERHDRMTNNGWKCIVERKVYQKAFYGFAVRAGVYVDDAFIGGEKQAARAAYRDLDQILGFSEPEPQPVSIFLGLQVEPLRTRNVSGHMLNELFLRQTNLTKEVVRRYKEHTGYTKLRQFQTPGLDSQGEEDKRLNELPGLHGDQAPRHLGGGLYLARGTRPDIQETLGGLARHTKEWSALDDKKLYRLMGYLDKTADWGILLTADLSASLESRRNSIYVDSDHGGDWRSGKSTGGCCGMIRDDGYTNIPIGHWSKLQDEPAASTPEAEYAALARALQMTAMPQQIMADEIFGQPMLLEVLIDNKAAEAVAKSGQSRKLKYMAKHRRVRTAFVKHALEKAGKDANRVVQRVESDENTSDLFTKPLGAEKHLKHSRGYGMMSLGGFRGSQRTKALIG